MNNKGFWFEKNTKKFSYLAILQKTDIMFCFLLISVFCMCSYGSQLFQYVKAADIQNSITTLHNFALNSQIFSQKDTQILSTIDRLSKTYQNPAKIKLFLTNDSLNFLDQIFSVNLFSNLFTSESQQFYKSLLTEFLKYPDEVLSLLWYDKEQTYLLLLKNENEKRPNGGFFGSFAKIKIEKAQLKSFEIVDSYTIPFLAPDAVIEFSGRQSQYVWAATWGFISSNKFGFTDIDYPLIAELYSKAYPEEYVAWIFWVKSSFLEKSYPSLYHKFYERQFINASIDLIRWEDSAFKKELYLKNVHDYFQANGLKLAFSLLTKYPSNQASFPVDGMFFEQPWLNEVLKSKHILRSQDQWLVYFWDSNISFSKIDSFVDKTITVQDKDWNIIKETNLDYLPVDSLSGAKITIMYNLSISPYYQKLIEDLSKKYNVRLTQKQLHILWLDALFQTKWIVIVPKGWKLKPLDGMHYFQQTIETPQSSVFIYKTAISKNNDFVFSNFVLEKE